MTAHMHIVPALVAAATLALASPAAASHQSTHRSSASDPADCASINVNSDEAHVASAEESLSPGTGPLHIIARPNGGIWVRGSDGPGFTVRACKFAVSESASGAEATLSSVRVQQDGDRISSRGPQSGRWFVHYIVGVPRGSTLKAETTNGPIAVREVDASVSVEAVNGPVSIRDSRGTIEARTVNGPVSVQGGAGDIRVGAQNGPLSVTLEGEQWDGEGLFGQTENGPLSVSIPGAYGSGVVVESGGRSPLSCAGCDETTWTRDGDSRRATVVSGPERVRLRTTNGPVNVRR